MHELKGEHFKIFMWLAANADNYKFALSTQAMSNDCNCTIKTCQTAIKSFIEKNILVETSANHYDFDEIGYGSRNSDFKNDSKPTKSIDTSIQTEEISTDGCDEDEQIPTYKHSGLRKKKKIIKF